MGAPIDGRLLGGEKFINEDRRDVPDTPRIPGSTANPISPNKVSATWEGESSSHRKGRLMVCRVANPNLTSYCSTF